MTISALLSQGWLAPQLEGMPKQSIISKRLSEGILSRFFRPQKPKFVKPKATSIYEYSSSVWLFLYSSVDFFLHCGWSVPVVIRTSIVALGCLALWNVPEELQSAKKALKQLYKEVSNSDDSYLKQAFEGIYYLGKGVLSLEVGVNGICEIFERLSLPTYDLKNMILSMTSWGKYCASISITWEALDLISWKAVSDPLYQVSQLTCMDRAQARKALGVIKSCKRFGKQSLDNELVASIEKNVNSWFFKNSSLEVSQLRELSEKLYEHSLAFANYQAWGFTANLLSILSVVISTHLAVSSLFLLISSIFRMLQIRCKMHHKWVC